MSDIAKIAEPIRPDSDMSMTPSCSETKKSNGIGRARPLWRSVAVFFVTVGVLQFGWSAARGTWLERLVIEVATVKTSVATINWISPEVGAYARNASIAAPGGGINVLNGCEGTEALFLLFAALVVTPMSWRWRAVGMVSSTLVVFLLNQVRLLVLFYSYRSNRALFDQLHGLVAPLVLIMASLMFFMLLQHWSRPRDMARLSDV